MAAPALKPETLCQVGFVVHDIEATAKKYSEAFGLPLPKITVTAGFDKTRTMLNGKPTEATAKQAFFQTGQVVIELLQPDEKPSVWREHLDKHGQGVHHIAFGVADTKASEAALAEHGLKVEQQGLYSDGSGMYTYLESAAQLGVVIELLESFKK